MTVVGGGVLSLSPSDASLLVLSDTSPLLDVAGGMVVDGTGSLLAYVPFSGRMDSLVLGSDTSLGILLSSEGGSNPFYVVTSALAADGRLVLLTNADSPLEYGRSFVVARYGSASGAFSSVVLQQSSASSGRRAVASRALSDFVGVPRFEDSNGQLRVTLAASPTAPSPSQGGGGSSSSSNTAVIVSVVVVVLLVVLVGVAAAVFVYRRRAGSLDRVDMSDMKPIETDASKDGTELAVV